MTEKSYEQVKRGMKKNDLIDQLVSEIPKREESGHWEYTAMELQVNQPLLRNCTNP